MGHYRHLRHRRFAMRCLFAFSAAVAGAASVDVATTFGTGGSGGVVAGAIGLGGLALLLLAWWGPFGRAEMDRWRRGAAGEVSTAMVLDATLGRRWKVWHDLAVPAKRQNIDHLVVGPTGVWLVDSKTTKAPVTARWGRVRVGGRPLDTSTTAWEADMVGVELARLLGESTSVEVVPLVVLHGEGLRRRAAKAGGVRVVGPSRLERQLVRGRRKLSKSEISRIASAVDASFDGASWRARRVGFRA